MGFEERGLGMWFCLLFVETLGYMQGGSETDMYMHTPYMQAGRERAQTSSCSSSSSSKARFVRPYTFTGAGAAPVSE